MKRAVVRAFCALTLGCFAFFAEAAEPLFPAPLHITRQIHDPLAAGPVVIDEYGYGNRLVSVRGGKTSIADYERGELTEIDRDAATYSVTKFEALAKALQVAGGSAPAPKADESSSMRSAPEMRSTGLRTTKLGRNAEHFAADVASAPGMKQRVEIALDPTVLISKSALEVLVGASFPFARRPEHDLVVATARERRGGGGGVGAMSTQREELYALPIEQLTTIELEGNRIELRASVVRVGSEPPPADVVSIPAGARLVPSRYILIQQELERQTRPASPAPNVP